jgi:hypothetical protein
LEEIELNIQLIKQLANIFDQMKNEPGFISFMNNEVHVHVETLKGFNNLQIESHEGRFPYKVFAEVDGIRIFAIAKDEELSDFPQFREFRKAELQRKLAILESEEEELA